MVLWRLRYKLSLRDLTEMFLIRGIVFSHEAVRDWEAKLTPALAETLRRRRRGKVGRSWYVDETYVKIQGRWCYLYRAIDTSGALVDVRLSETRDMASAMTFFQSAKTVTDITPARVTTDGHDSYPRSIRTVLGEGVRHRTNRYLNNRIEQTSRKEKASPPLPDFVEASTNYETSFGPVQTATNMFPPITADCTSSPGPLPRSASSGPRDPVAPQKRQNRLYLSARGLTKPSDRLRHDV